MMCAMGKVYEVNPPSGRVVAGRQADAEVNTAAEVGTYLRRGEESNKTKASRVVEKKLNRLRWAHCVEKEQ